MNKLKSLYAFMCCMLIVACSEEEIQMSAGQTGIQVSLTERVEVETRATPDELERPLVQEFHLKIADAAGKSIYDGSYTSELIPTQAGSYDLEAAYGENLELALDAPYYKGKAKAEVTDGESEKVTIACTVANALASVVFNDEGDYKFGDQFSSYGVEVTVGRSSATLTTDGKSAYYRAGSEPTFVFVGKLRNGEEVAVPLADDKFTEAATFAAGAHCEITLKLGAATPGVRVEVSKVEVKDVTIEETIPMEWLPKPKVEATGFDANNTLVFVETESKEAKLDLNLSSALQDIKLTFNFEDPQFASLNKEEGFLLSKDRAELESTLGITLPSIGDTEASIDLSVLVNKLQTNAGTPTTNVITIDVQANNRWSSEGETKNGTYTLTCNKPEFSIAVQEGNCWSRTFTIDEPTIIKGNEDLLKTKLIYQYKEREADDSNWQTCSNGLEQIFSGYPEKKEFQVRAFYREGIVSNNVDVKLENTVQLPNADMEDWWIETKKASGFLSSDKTYYTFHPYVEGAANYSWWDTNNSQAQGGTVALNIWYMGCFASCVSYTEDAYRGSKAALMYVSGCGGGYANTSGTYLGGAMVGSLFIGSYNSGIVQGHSFESRPTSLSFWYKYKPYNSDTFKVLISLKNGDSEIATGVYEPTAYSTEDEIYHQAIVDLDYIDNNKKATAICVQFLASNKTSLSESDFQKGTTIVYPTIGEWTVHMGSILKIDDISLIYDK